jgi:hypothetical protein
MIRDKPLVGAAHKEKGMFFLVFKDGTLWSLKTLLRLFQCCEFRPSLPAHLLRWLSISR